MARSILSAFATAYKTAGVRSRARSVQSTPARWTLSARASTTRPGMSIFALDRSRRVGGRVRAASGLFAAGEGRDRRSQALRLLFDRVEWPPLRISPLVSQASRRDPSLDRHVRVDPRRDGRVPALFDREPELVRDRLPAIRRGS